MLDPQEREFEDEVISDLVGDDAPDEGKTVHDDTVVNTARAEAKRQAEGFKIVTDASEETAALGLMPKVRVLV